MARKLKQEDETKSETLNARLSKKAAFALEIVTHLKTHNKTATVEIAVEALADDIAVWGPGAPVAKTRWRDVYHNCAGVIWVRLFNDPYFPTSAEHDRIKEFVHAHPQFFMDESRNPLLPYCEVLWDTANRLQPFVSLWEQRKHTDYYAAGEAMVAALKKAGVKPPPWPPRGADKK